MISHDSRLARWIKVQAYKHDGKLHRQWSPAYLVSETPDYYAICSKASCVTESDGRKWITKEHAAFILFKKRWMNVIAMFKKDWGICYYVNIASPTIFDGGFLRYIDYDLDVKLFPDHVVKELDEQEFRRHSAKYGYDEETIDICVNMEKRIEKMMRDGEFPFIDDEVHRLYNLFLAENRPYEVNKKRPQGDHSSTD